MLFKTLLAPETPQRNSLEQWEQTVSQRVLCAHTNICIYIWDISQAKCRLHFCTEFSFRCVCVCICICFLPQLRSICVRVSLSECPCICECAKHSVSEPRVKNYLLCLPKGRMPEQPQKCTKNIPKRGKERGFADIWTIIILYQHITESKHHLLWFGSLIYGLRGTSSLSASVASACIFVVHLVDTFRFGFNPFPKTLGYVFIHYFLLEIPDRSFLIVLYSIWILLRVSCAFGSFLLRQFCLPPL